MDTLRDGVEERIVTGPAFIERHNCTLDLFSQNWLIKLLIQDHITILYIVIIEYCSILGYYISYPPPRR